MPHVPSHNKHAEVENLRNSFFSQCALIGAYLLYG
jgi:hypothetical protein